MPTVCKSDITASDFNQAYQRLKYLQHLSEYRIHQRNLIRQLADSLSGKKDQLACVKKEKTQLLTVQQKEKNNLDKEKKEQIAMVNSLASKEKKLKADLKDKQKLEAKLNKLIENAIRKEIEAAQLAAKKKSQSTLTASVDKRKPKIETKPYQTADGSSADARVYSVARGNSEFVMTIVDLTEKQTDEKTVLDHAIKTLAQDGEVKLDITHRISAVYGRQLSIASNDGTHSSVAVFYYKKRLYQIAGIAHPGENATADAIRFQQSLIFTNNAANRTPLEPVFQVFGRVFGTNN